MFKQLSVFVLVVCCLFSFTCLSWADYKKVKAIGTVETRFVNDGKKKEALEDAKRKALSKYFIERGAAEIFNNLKEELYKNINIYVPEAVALNSGKLENGYWTVDVEASIDETQVEALINRNVKVNNAKKEEVNLAFIFVARDTDKVRKFAAKTTARTVENEAYKEKSAENEGGESAGENTKLYDKTTGGSIEKTSDRKTYKIANSEDIDNKITEVFNKAEFSVVIPSEAGIDRSTFEKDFSNGDDISDATRKAAIDAARKSGLTYLAIATLDTDEQLVDQATGMQKVYVKVNGYVLDLTGKFTKKACTVGPKLESGLGESPEVAKTNALINAGTAVAKDLVDQLRIKMGA